MRRYTSMKPQDIVILLAIIARGHRPWLMKDISRDINISPSEVTESLKRSWIAGLIDEPKRKVKRHALLEFLVHGIQYVFPQELGGIKRGIPTAFSAPPLNSLIMSNEIIVWPHPTGYERGQAIEPLYPTFLEGIQERKQLYEMLALVDTLRIRGRVRERELACSELKERIINNNNIYQNEW